MLIVIPTAKEFDALLGECRVREFGCAPTALGRLTVHRVAELRAHVACGGLGKTEFGVRTQHLLDHSEVSLLVCAGGAGALIGDLAIGDVVVATETVEHDFKSRFSNRPPGLVRRLRLSMRSERHQTRPDSRFTSARSQAVTRTLLVRAGQMRATSLPVPLRSHGKALVAQEPQLSAGPGFLRFEG